MKYNLMMLGGFALALASFAAGRAYPVRASHPSQEEIFKNRLTCDTLAKAYVKAESDDMTALDVDHVDFNPARNSCIASTSGGRYYSELTYRDYKVVDLLSHEELFWEWCDETRSSADDFCGNGRDMDLMRQRDKAFDDAMHPQDVDTKKPHA